ncbi:hypothetical protein [Xanthobacter sp. VNH20]|uniref:hypothetical protein n=1 Tax=Xanthobacter TaxID=279 RepID=UPI0032B4DB86
MPFVVTEVIWVLFMVTPSPASAVQASTSWVVPHFFNSVFAPLKSAISAMFPSPAPVIHG